MMPHTLAITPATLARPATNPAQWEAMAWPTSSAACSAQCRKPDGLFSPSPPVAVRIICAAACASAERPATAALIACAEACSWPIAALYLSFSLVTSALSAANAGRYAGIRPGAASGIGPAGGLAPWAAGGWAGSAPPAASSSRFQALRRSASEPALTAVPLTALTAASAASWCACSRAAYPVLPAG